MASKRVDQLQKVLKYCPQQQLVYILRKTGYHGYYWVNCGRWSCNVCRGDKLRGIAERLADVGPTKVWSITMPKDRVAAVRKAIRKANLDYLSLALRGGDAFFVSSGEASGVRWSLGEPKRLVVAVLEVWAWEGEQPTRTTWRGWPGEAETLKKEPVLFRGITHSVADLKGKLLKAGVEIDSEVVVGDPGDLSERLVAAFGGGAMTSDEAGGRAEWKPSMES